MAKDDTQALLKQQMKRLIGLGVSQRALAEHLNVSESWLSRWLSGQSRPISVPEMDRYRAYTRRFCELFGKAELIEKDPQPVLAPAEPFPVAPAVRKRRSGR